MNEVQQCRKQRSKNKSAANSKLSIGDFGIPTNITAAGSDDDCEESDDSGDDSDEYIEPVVAFDQPYQNPEDKMARECIQKPFEKARRCTNPRGRN